MVIGPLPPPIHGNALVTDAVAARLSVIARVTRITTAPPSLERGLLYHLTRIARVAKALGAVASAPANERSLVYASVDAGWGALYTSAILGVARLRGFPVALHHHSFAYIRKWHARMELLTRIAGRDGLHLLLCPNMAKGFLASYPRARCTMTIPNGFLVSPDAEPIPAARSPLVLGHLSNLGVEKGLLEVIDTARACRANNRDVRLVLAGPVVSASDRRILEDTQRELGDALDYMGPVFGESKRRFFDAIGVFLFPSQKEAQPLVLLEAMSASVPCVAFDRGCIADLVGRDAGVVVPQNEAFVDSAVAAIAGWAEDDSAYARASSAARRRYEAVRDESEERLKAFLAVVLEGR